MRINAAPGIEMACGAIQEITRWTKGPGGAASAPVPNTPVQPESGGSGGNKETPTNESSGNGGDSAGSDYARSRRAKSNYTHISNYSRRVHYY